LLEIDENRARNVAIARMMEERIERIVLIILALLNHLTIGIDAMFQTVSN
jgi:hypothetical protein